MILSPLRLAAYNSTVFSISRREFGELEMEELGFSSTRYLTISMFSSIISIRGGIGSLEGETFVTGGHKSVHNSGEGVTVR